MNKMHLGASIRDGFSRYFDFSGRTSRATFWDWVLFVVLANIAAVILDSLIFHAAVVNFSLVPTSNNPLFSWLVSIILLIPNISIIVRRLRDARFSPLWALLLLVPVLGLIILLVMSSRPGPEDLKKD